MPGIRTAALFLLIALSLCLRGYWRASSQSGNLRRVTFTSEESININPSISGDGRRLAFESTENLAGSSNDQVFRAIRADISPDIVAFEQFAASRAPAPGISQDGTRLVFAAMENQLGTNPDFNSEIFYFDGEALRQITHTNAEYLSQRSRDGNFLPSLSDDGRFIAFSSNRNLAGANPDANYEIFIFDVERKSFAQLTDTVGTTGATFAKISGDGSRVAYIREESADEGAPLRDLLVQPREGGEARLVASGMSNLSMTFGRAISDDGSRIVYQAESAAATSQVFLFDGRSNRTRQITSLSAPSTLGSSRQDVPLHPTISGDGNRIAFVTRRTVGELPNGDRSLEVYLYDIPTTQFSRITSAPASADGFDGSNPAAEVLTSLSDDGTKLVFNFPRSLSGPVSNSDNQSNSEIYVASPAPRPSFGELKILNYASFGNEPSTAKAIAPDSQAVALGASLADCTEQPRKNYSTNTFPTEVCGTRVMVQGRPAQILFVSPSKVVFLTPSLTETGPATVTITNSEDYPSRGQVLVIKAAPGIFTRSGDGKGEGVFLEADTNAPAPFDLSAGARRVIIFSTGARNASELSASVAGINVAVESFMASRDLAGLDEIRVLLPSVLPSGNLNLIVRADGRASNTVQIPVISNPIPVPAPTATPSPLPSPLPSPTPHPTPDSTPTPTTLPSPSPTPTPAPPAAGTIVISQLYGGGGNTGATLQNDFIELFNRGEQAVEVTGWSVQYQTATGTGTWQRTVLSGAIQPGHYLLIKLAAGTSCSGGPCGDQLPVVPDLDPATKFNLSGVSGKVAVVTNSTALNGACPNGADIMDLVGYGSAASTSGFCFEGDGPALPALTNTTAAFRSGGGCIDTDNNSADFTSHAPAPRNSTSPLKDCFAVSLSIAGVTVKEGDSNAVEALLSVRLSAASSKTVMVDFATENGTATALNDYMAASGTLTFSPGETSKSIAVSVYGDTISEENESFSVRLHNPTNATLSVSEALCTILDDDPLPSLSINDVSVSEGDGGTTNAMFAVTLSASTAQTVTVRFRTSSAGPATATGSEDFQEMSGTLIFNPAETSKTIAIPVRGDTLVESDETFFIELSGASNSQLSDSQGRCTITNDDAADLVISQIYGGGGNSGSTLRNDFIEIFNRGATTVDFSITPYSVQYASVSTGSSANFGGSSAKTDLMAGRLAPGQYYLIQEAAASGGTANLPPPDATGTIALSATTGKVALVAGTAPLPSISCPGDNGSAPFNPVDSVIADMVGYGGSANTAGHCYEGDAPASAPGNTTALFRKAGGCIDTNTSATDFLVAAPAPRNSASALNNCGSGLRPEIIINDLSVAEGNTGTKTVIFGVTLSISSPLPVSVDYSTANNSATVGEDYQQANGKLTFAPGETTKPVEVTIIGDMKDETDETFFVNLTNASNATILINRGIGTVKDDDPQPSLSINDPAITEGDGGQKTIDFTVTLSATSGNTVAVNYQTADGTSTAASDYQPATGVLTFNPGQTQKTVSVTIYGDTEIESDETFFVNLSVAANASILDGQGKGTIANDDLAADLSIAKTISQALGGPGSTLTYTINVTNNGPDVAERVIVTDNLPSNITFIACVSASGKGACTGSGNNRMVTFPSISKGSSETITIQAKMNDSAVNGSVVTNTATVSSETHDPRPANNTATMTATVQPSADLSITQTVSAATVPSGGSITYTLIVTNNGPDAAQDVLITDNLPAQLSFVSCESTPGGACGGDGNNRTVSYAFLPAGASSVITLIAGVKSSVSGGTAISNSASATSSTFDHNAANNSATNNTQVNTIIINEALIASSTSSTTRPDFLELYNTTDRTIDISGLVVSFRPGGTSNSPVAVTLPGAPGSGTTTIAAHGYFVIANGASVLNGSGISVAADFNASATPFNLNNTTGGIKIELDGIKLDGLTYQGSATLPSAAFISYGEGSIFIFTAGTTANIVRGKAFTDTNNNAADFRSFSSATTITAGGANPP